MNWAFQSENFYPVEAGGYWNAMVNFAGGYVMLALSPESWGAWLVASPFIFAFVGWDLIANFVNTLYTDFSQTGVKFIIDYFIKFALWLPISGFIYLLRLIEYGFWEVIVLFVPAESKVRAEDTDIGTGL